jgi:hypothetical protein
MFGFSNRGDTGLEPSAYKILREALRKEPVKV